jgi:hypothetical protein
VWITNLPKAEMLGSVLDSNLRPRLNCAENVLLHSISIKEVLNCTPKHLLNKVKRDKNTNNTLQKPLIYYCEVICFDRISTFKRARYGGTSRKVAVSIPYGIIGIFQEMSSSCLAVALRSTQPLAEMSRRNICCGVKTAGD